MPFSVIPAKAGIQEKQALLDPGFRRGDGFDDFLRTHQNCRVRKKSENALFCHSRENGNPGNSRSSGLPPSRE
jgi:hypothetical protein